MANFSVWHVLILAGGLAVAIVLVVLAARSWRRRGVDATIGVTLVLSALYAVLAGIGAVITLVVLLTASQLSMTVPVAQFWPTLAPDTVIEGTSATVAGGGFISADVQVDGVGTAARVLWAIGQTLGVLVPASIAALIAIACFQLLRGEAFAPAVARAAMITAVIVLVGGSGAQVLSEIAGSITSGQIFQWSGGSATALTDGSDPFANWPHGTFSVTFPLWPIGAGLGFAALAAVLQYGAKLQRETEGLV